MEVRFGSLADKPSRAKIQKMFAVVRKRTFTDRNTDVCFVPIADIRKMKAEKKDRLAAASPKSEALIFFSASKTLCALANHRRPYEFFERDIPIRMRHCRRLE
jgi:hypothetical protein